MTAAAVAKSAHSEEMDGLGVFLADAPRPAFVDEFHRQEEVQHQFVGERGTGIAVRGRASVVYPTLHCGGNLDD